MKKLQIILPILVFVLIIIQAVMSEGVESRIFLVGALVYGEILCLHLELKAMRDEKAKSTKAL